MLIFDTLFYITILN